MRRRTFLAGIGAGVVSAGLSKSCAAASLSVLSAQSSDGAANPSNSAGYQPWPFAIADQWIGVPVTSGEQPLCLAAGAAVGIAAQEYTDASQGWRVLPIDTHPGEFQIVPDADRSHVLSVDADGNIVLNPTNADDPLQRWQFERGGEHRFDWYCVVLKARKPGNCYLTRVSNGNSLKLASRTRSTNDQAWVIEPRTPVAGWDIPQWEYHARIDDLARFLATQREKVFVRVFADEVVISSPFSWMTTPEDLRADIRIDCHRLVLYGTPLIVLNGSYNGTEWNRLKKNPLDNVSFNPDLSQPAKTGLLGFSAGKLIVNALEIDHQSLQRLTIHAIGGAGGCGQAGYPGRNGDVERGWDGENGGNGGDGGHGGDGGTVILRCDSITPAPPIVLQALTEGGSGGAGGAGGPGGAASNAAEPGTGRILGKSGQDGSPGRQGAVGQTGQVQIDTSGGTLAAMQGDTFPGSLRSRIHRAINDEMYQLAKTGDLGSFTQRTAWLGDIAGRLGYSEVSIRLNKAAAYSKQAYLANPDWYKDLQAQELTMGSDALREDLRLFDESLPPGDTSVPSALVPAPPTNLTGVITAVGAGPQAATRPMSGIPGPGERPINGGLPPGFPIIPHTPPRNYCQYAIMSRRPDMDFSKILDSVPAGAAQVDVGALMGNPSYITRAAADYWRSVSVADVQKMYNTPSPGSNSDIRSLCPQCFEFAFDEWLLIVAGGAAEDPPGHSCNPPYSTVGQCTQEPNTKEVCVDPMTDPVYEAEWEAASAESAENNRSRDEMDAVNEEDLKRERDVERARNTSKKTQDDDDRLPRFYGASIVAILDSLDPLDTNTVGDNASNRYVAVFDGFIDLGITDPVVHLAATFAIANFQTVMVTVVVNQTTAKSLVPGAWHRIDVDYSSSLTPEGRIEAFIGYPEFSEFHSKSGLAWRVSTIGEWTFSTTGISRLDWVQAAMLDIGLMYADVPLVPSSKEGSQKIAMTSARPATEEYTLNAGMGDFNIFSQPGESDSFAFDVGCGSPIGYSEMLDALMKMLALNQDTVVLSHWDKDHYAALTRADNDAQARCKIVGPAYGLRGVTLTALVKAIASHGPGHLFIVGDVTTAYMQFDPELAQNAVRCSTFVDLRNRLDAPQFPGNVDLALSTHYPVEDQYDKNNTLSINAVLTLQNSGVRLLMPGDCSYSNVVAEQRAPITHLQAAHHGSWWTLRTANGLRNVDPRDPGDSDIPQPLQLNTGIVYFSYGLDNRYNISVDRVEAYYRAKGWGGYVCTSRLLTDGYFTLP